jgi:hypothetical protein
MFERLLFGLGMAVFVFIAGIVVGWYRLPPSVQIDTAIEAGRDLQRHWRSYAGIEPTKYLRPLHPDLPEHSPVATAETQAGFTLVAGLFDNKVGVELIDLSGNVVHRWPILFHDIWAGAPHLSQDEIPFNDWDTIIHGMELFPDGDLIVSFENQGLARLDRCGQVRWRLPYRTHHAVSVDDQGDLWVLGRRDVISQPDPRFPGLHPPFQHDTILQVAAEDGTILQDISLLEVIYGSRFEGVLFANGADMPGSSTWGVTDPLHANHAEVLSRTMAPAFPMFAAGDILISLRNIDLIAVIDGSSHQIKWSQTGPWVRQHDPHFRPDGQISVFDNRRLANASRWAGDRPTFASRIVSVDPRTDRITVLLEGSREQPFYTDQMGKHQYLPNGNVLITEPMAGRAFEATPDGRIVWWFVNRYDASRVAKISEARRYPTEYAAFASAGCPEAEVAAQ